MPTLITYQTPVVINVVLDNSATFGSSALSNFPFSRSDLSIVQGITNVVSVFCRDVDRQIVTLCAGQSLTVNIVDIATQTLLLTRQLTVVDPTQGLFSFAISPTDTALWNPGPLTYSIIINNPDGSQNLLYTDLNYTTFGYATFLPGPIPGPAQPLIMNPQDFLITDGWATSPNLPGSIFPGGVQTYSIYTTAFTGPIYIQASLQKQPQVMTDWFQVETVNITVPTTGVTAVTTTGNYIWMRIQVPIAEFILDPNVLLPLTTGTVNQVMYKN
jgi:hypothetical protein